MFHWETGVELILLTTEQGIMLQLKSDEKNMHTAKSLRGFLQHKSEPVPTEQLSKPVEYDSF
jgi:hypothetical protein